MSCERDCWCVLCRELDGLPPEKTFSSPSIDNNFILRKSEDNLNCNSSLYQSKNKQQLFIQSLLNKTFNFGKDRKLLPKIDIFKKPTKCRQRLPAENKPPFGSYLFGENVIHTGNAHISEEEIIGWETDSSISSNQHGSVNISSVCDSTSDCTYFECTSLNQYASNICSQVDSGTVLLASIHESEKVDISNQDIANPEHSNVNLSLKEKLTAKFESSEIFPLEDQTSNEVKCLVTDSVHG